MSQKKILLIAFSVVLLLLAGRMVRGHFDASYFIVAGTDFVDGGKTTTPIVVQNGQGYDGQFFYRYALNPFDFDSHKYGVKLSNK